MDSEAMTSRVVKAALDLEYPEACHYLQANINIKGGYMEWECVRPSFTKCLGRGECLLKGTKPWYTPKGERQKDELE